MNRRSFIAALLASAATGAATPVPAQPVAVFASAAATPDLVFVGQRMWFATGPSFVTWSETEDLHLWEPAP